MSDNLYKNGKKIIQHTDISEIKGKTILMTGASGLFGVHFLYSIVSLEKNEFPQKVYAIHHSELPDYLEELKKYEFIEFIQGDLSEEKFCYTLPEADIIIHAAGYGQPGKFMKNQISAFRINVTATMILLDKLKQDGKFLYASSCAVYTGCKEKIYSEENIGMANTNHSRICYIEGKRAGEAICHMYRNERQKDAKSIRISYTYGPGVKTGDVRAMYEFIEKAMTGDINLRDQGKAEHTYCYITDAVAYSWKILLNGKEEVYNIAGKENVSIYELASKIAKIMDRKVTVPDTENGISGAQMTERIDISRIEQEFGEQEFVVMEEGLKETIEWYKSALTDLKV